MKVGVQGLQYEMMRLSFSTATLSINMSVKCVHSIQNMVHDMNLGKFSHPTFLLLYNMSIEDKQYMLQPLLAPLDNLDYFHF